MFSRAKRCSLFDRGKNAPKYFVKFEHLSLEWMLWRHMVTLSKEYHDTKHDDTKRNNTKMQHSA
jgi:hypothetical protein